MSEDSSVNAPEPGAAVPGQADDVVPGVYRRWCLIDRPEGYIPPEKLAEVLWHGTSDERKAFWRSLDAAQGQPAPELAAVAAPLAYQRTPEQAAYDPQAEQDHAEWLGWSEANGYGNEYARDNSYEDMREAFTAGMQAARDLDAAALAAEVRAGHVRIETEAPQPAPVSGAAPGQAATCPKAFIPRAADGGDAHACTCDRPEGHPVKGAPGGHHCPGCDVWWTLASEDSRKRGLWNCEFCRSSFAYLDDAEEHVRNKHPSRVAAHEQPAPGDGITPGQAAADREIARAALARIATTILEGPEDDRTAIVAIARGALCEMSGHEAAAREPQPAPGHVPAEEVGAQNVLPLWEPQPAPGPCPGCESLRRQHAETCGEAGILAGALSEIVSRTEDSGQGLAIAAYGIARNALDHLHGLAPAESQPASASASQVRRHAEQAAPEVRAAMAALAEYERLAEAGTVPNSATRTDIRRRAGLEAP